LTDKQAAGFGGRFRAAAGQNRESDQAGGLLCGAALEISAGGAVLPENRCLRRKTPRRLKLWFGAGMAGKVGNWKNLPLKNIQIYTSAACAAINRNCVSMFAKNHKLPQTFRRT
jgi:hypothetical protein